MEYLPTLYHQFRPNEGILFQILLEYMGMPGKISDLIACRKFFELLGQKNKKSLGKMVGAPWDGTLDKKKPFAPYTVRLYWVYPL